MTSIRNTRLVDDQSAFANMRAAEKAFRVQQDVLAAKIVAGHSRNTADCAQLLAMLGLDLSELS
ncbi:hypothetical protein [Nocardia stercoris]|uniref:Uncharacterized protein n=1 Tax=Nocardia stercoris TaxID=2483361 RepID=A0A3M2KVD4_9NOCA|nr:hypothetical protein [Nocardia stercoris]RMI28173.1 hypothetical protein EBN03_31230 [Nocardia stercoris]